MGRIKKIIFRGISPKDSLKWRLLLYMPIPIVLALLGTYQIGYAANDWQTWYIENVFTGNELDVLEEDADDSMIVYGENHYTV